MAMKNFISIMFFELSIAEFKIYTDSAILYTLNDSMKFVYLTSPHENNFVIIRMSLVIMN